MAQWNKYEASTARKPGRPGREVRPKSLTVDFHSHVGVPRAAELVRPHLDLASNPLARFANDETKALNQKQEADIVARGGLDKRLADLDAMGVDMQVIKPPPPQCYYAVPLDIAVKAAQVINDGIAEFVAKKPDRLKGFGSVPMPDGNEAAKELERCVGKLGFKGVQVLTNVNGRELSDPAFAPFWQKAEELGAFVVIHPNGFTHAERLSRFYFNNVIGNPLETTIALHYLIFDGVLERHPNLKILAVHGGGYLASYAGRIDHAWGARSDSHGTLPHPPTTYLQEDLLRHGGIHPAPAAGAGASLWCRQNHHGHRLSLRHGRLRPRRPRVRGRARPGDRRRHLRRQCQAAARIVALPLTAALPFAGINLPATERGDRRYAAFYCAVLGVFCGTRAVHRRRHRPGGPELTG